MEADIMNGKYLEYGDFNGNLYGTRLDTVREVIDSGKMCVLDVNPTVSSVTASFFSLSSSFVTWIVPHLWHISANCWCIKFSYMQSSHLDID